MYVNRDNIIVVVVVGLPILSVSLLPSSPTHPSQLSPIDAFASLFLPPPLNEDNNKDDNNIGSNEYNGYNRHNRPPPHLTQCWETIKELVCNVLN